MFWRRVDNFTLHEVIRSSGRRLDIRSDRRVFTALIHNGEFNEFTFHGRHHVLILGPDFSAFCSIPNIATSTQSVQTILDIFICILLTPTAMSRSFRYASEFARAWRPRRPEPPLQTPCCKQAQWRRQRRHINTSPPTKATASAIPAMEQYRQTHRLKNQTTT